MLVWFKSRCCGIHYNFVRLQQIRKNNLFIRLFLHNKTKITTLEKQTRKSSINSRFRGTLPVPGTLWFVDRRFTDREEGAYDSNLVIEVEIETISYRSKIVVLLKIKSKLNFKALQEKNSNLLSLCSGML